MSEREFTRLVGRWVGGSVDPWVVKLLFVFPLTNAQLDLTKSSANVKHSKA